MHIIIKLSSFTVSMILIAFSLQSKPARADSKNDFFKQSLELIQKKKFNKKAADQLYQDTVIQERTQKVNAMSSDNTAHNEKLSKEIEKKEFDESEVKNAPGSKENPIDIKTGLSKLDQKPLEKSSDSDSKATDSKPSKKPVAQKEKQNRSTTPSEPTIKVDDSNLPDEVSFPGRSE